MNFKQIEETCETIKSFLRKDYQKEALQALEEFIRKIEDEDLETQAISLWARFNAYKRKERQDTQDPDSFRRDVNRLRIDIAYLLQECKQTAFDKASLKVGNELSNIAKEGNFAIEELKQLNVILAESRLVELEVTKRMFGSIFSEEERSLIDRNSQDLKAVLKRHGIEVDLVDSDAEGNESMAIQSSSSSSRRSQDLSGDQVQLLMRMVSGMLKKR